MQLIVILEIMHKSNEDERQEQMRTKQLKKKTGQGNTKRFTNLDVICLFTNSFYTQYCLL